MSRGGRPASAKRPASSRSKSSKGSRPSSSKDGERPASAKVKDRPPSSKVKDRPESGKSDDKVKDRPASGKVKERPSSSKVKDRPASGKVVKEEDSGEKVDDKENQPTKEASVNGEENAESGLVMAVVVTHSEESRVKSSPRSKGGKADNRKAQSDDDSMVKKDSSPRREEHGSAAKQNKDTDRSTSGRQQSPKQVRTHPPSSSSKPAQPDATKQTSAKKDDPNKKTVRVSGSKEHASSASKNQSRLSATRSAYIPRGKSAQKNSPSTAPQQTRASRQTQQKPRQKQTTRRHNRSLSSSRSRSSSRSSSRDSHSSGMNTKQRKSKRDEAEGEGLNLFSDNDNTDHEDDAAHAKQKAEEDAKEMQRRRPRSGRLIASVQNSVKRYEQMRRSIRELQKMRRAEIYANHCRNVALFHSLLRVHGSPNGVPTWDQILQHQPKTPRDADQKRGKDSAKMSARGEGKDAGSGDGLDQNHVDDNEKTTGVDRRHGGAASAKGNNLATDEDLERRLFHTESPPPPIGSPGRMIPYEYGNPMFYRHLQRQRTEDMHRLLLKAYKPSLPHDLFSHGKSQEKTQNSSLPPRSSRPSTGKSLPATRPSTGQGRPTSTVSTTSSPSGMSHAQYKAVQKSYTIMTRYGTRSIRPRSGHPSTQTQSQRPTTSSHHRSASACCTNGFRDHSDHRDHSASPDRSRQNHNGVVASGHR